MVFWNKYRKFVHKLVDIGMIISSVFLVLMSLLVTVEIIGRGVFNVSTMIADEYSGYFCVFATFFGAAYSFREEAFINVDIVYSKFKPGFKKWVDLVMYLLVAAFLIYLTDRCFYVASYSFQNSVVSSSISRTPLYIPQSAMFVGLVIFVMQMTVSIGDLFIPAEKEIEGGSEQ